MSNGVVRFGVFEVDPDERELRRSGLRVRLQEQPLQVLLALLEHPGEVVNREDLVRRLWADGTFVDYERGLNAAVNRLRQALSDCADVPRYVETIPRRGYRFTGQIDPAGGSGPPDPVSPPAPRSRLWPAVLLALFGIAGAAWLFVGTPARRADARL